METSENSRIGKESEWNIAVTALVFAVETQRFPANAFFSFAAFREATAANDSFEAFIAFLAAAAAKRIFAYAAVNQAALAHRALACEAC